MNADRRRMMKEAYQKRVSAGGVYIIENTETGKKLLLAETDLKGAENKFRFVQMTESVCPYGKLSADWRKYGAKVFRFQILEQLEQKEDQTREEFLEELKVAEEIWREKIPEEELY